MIFKDLEEIKKYANPLDWWIKYFLQPFSIRLVSLLRNTNVTANHLTFLSTGFVLLAFPLICWGNYFLLLIAAMLLQFGLILDCADGNLARVKGIDSAFGEWLDRGTDRIKDFLIIFALTFRYSKIDENGWILGIFCLFIIFFVERLGLQAKLFPILPLQEEFIDKKEKTIVKKLKNFKRKMGFGFFQIGEQYFLYSLFLLLNKIDWLFYFIIMYGSLSIIWVIFNTYRENRLLSKKS